MIKKKISTELEIAGAALSVRIESEYIYIYHTTMAFITIIRRLTGNIIDTASTTSFTTKEPSSTTPTHSKRMKPETATKSKDTYNYSIGGDEEFKAYMQSSDFVF